MKTLPTLSLFLLALSVRAQDRKSAISVHYNKLTELKGTDFTIATVSESSKGGGRNKAYLLFINTRSGTKEQVILPYQSYRDRIEHVQIEKLKINQVLVSAKTVDLNKKEGIDWEDPTQVFVFSIDGKQRTQITDDGFFVSTWSVNAETGRVVIAGHYDTNGNGKEDKGDEPRVSLYDLATMQMVGGS